MRIRRARSDGRTPSGGGKLKTAKWAGCKSVNGQINGEAQEIRAGDCLQVPRGAVHYSENVHDEAARVLIVLNPGSIGRAYFDEIAKAVSGPGKPDPARLTEIMLRYGLVPA
jgi:hypothetical protein